VPGPILNFFMPISESSFAAMTGSERRSILGVVWRTQLFRRFANLRRSGKSSTMTRPRGYSGDAPIRTNARLAVWGSGGDRGRRPPKLWPFWGYLAKSPPTTNNWPKRGGRGLESPLSCGPNSRTREPRATIHGSADERRAGHEKPNGNWASTNAEIAFIGPRASTLAIEHRLRAHRYHD